MRPSTDAERQLVTDNMGLVYHVAHKMYLTGRIPSNMMEDAIGEGMYALTKAAQLYDPSKGYRFSTLAIICIQREIRDWVDKEFTQIKRDGLRLDEPFADRSDKNWSDTFPAKDDVEADAVDWLSDAVDLISKNHPKRKNIEMLLEYANGRSMVDIALEHGVTRQRILARINEAKAVLRNSLKRNDWY